MKNAKEILKIMQRRLNELEKLVDDQPQEPELEASIRKWFEENNRQYPSAEAWREAMIKGVTKIAREKIVGEVKRPIEKFLSRISYMVVSPEERNELRQAIENLKGGEDE